MNLILGDAELRDKLMTTSEEFRRLAREHQSYDHELENLSHRHHLSDEERIQEVTLKKKKLMLKDRMHSMVLEYRKHLEPES